MTYSLIPEIAKMYEDAWERWGSLLQLNLINEECSEVIKAVCKYIRNKEKGPLDSITEEIVDTTIMFEQFIHMFDLSDEYFLIRQTKLERLKEKLNK